MTNIKILRTVAFVMLSLSICSIILGVYLYIKKDEYLKTCKLITCKITKIDEPVRGEAVLTFTEINGNYKPFTYNISYDASESNLDYKVGETYEVYYDSKNIADSEIKDVWINYLAPMILIIIGFVFMLDCPILLFVANKQVKKKATTLDNLRKEVISE